MPSAEELDILGKQGSAALREWEDVVEVEVVGLSTLDALAFITFPDFQLHIRWNDPLV
jgi:hypothetical protein